ncbi:flagellar hook-basal body complex protein FliE [Lachnospiraceae bacterium]|jgi:flagellar hook-basal body complex protein FliE|nr:flagellar hook-basal body complex protein FliE [Lachnospiraceae bacterium]MCX4271982.1 flagellar hook-basal body complex protein FliE [Acetatifactor sp.]GFH95914.1 flagellar hook-basal body complex protein FliE [Lachnospiraceae bacterium]
MDYAAAINGISSLGLEQTSGVGLNSLTGVLTKEDNKVEGTMFDAFLSSAIDNLKTTNNYLSTSENEKIKFILGETENAHDLSVAMQKASDALQYTVVFRDKLLEAYNQIMQMQI